MKKVIMLLGIMSIGTIYAMEREEQERLVALPRYYA